MSTFGGFMPEFPHIRVDYFRQIHGVPPPLACFLSHVHSDHLAGLYSLKSPFIYCSAATKALLLRLERYPHRVNFEKGIVESRKQHFKHLSKILKPIPLHTPTRIELAPGNDIQVTLFDANHCTGAVMFLIEGDGRAVLYTGDIRAEPWFVNALARNPCIIEYTSNLKTLDCIYLDTSFTEDITFPTKAEGLAELLQKVSKYPPTTEFHIAAWTFGYEEVWMALSRALKSSIHVDSYKMRLYESLRDREEGLYGSHLAPEAPMLTGYVVGNTDHPGILTLDHTVRLHSCEKRIKCRHLGDQTVWIKPIIARTSSGQEICEIGVGGGGGDLKQRPEIELDSDVIIMQLMELFVNQGDASILSNIRRMLLAGLHSSRKALILDDVRLQCKQADLSLEELANILARSVAPKPTAEDMKPIQEEVQLPKVITFPYSRHSSYAELRDIVRVFRPMDIYPCTVDKANWHEGVSMRALFGDLCSTSTFRHDQEMHETLSDPHEDNTQYSWNEFNRNDSRSSSEDGNYQSDISGDDYKRLTEEQRKNLATGSMVLDKTVSQDSHRDNVTEHGASVRVDTTSGLLKACSSTSHLVPAQSVGSSPESVPQGLRRRANLEENGNNHKRARLKGDHTSIMLSISSDDLETSQLEGNSQPAIKGVPRVGYYDSHDGVYCCKACKWEFWRRGGTCTGCGAGEPTYYEVTSCTEEGANEDAKSKPELKSKSQNHNRYPRISLSSNAAENTGANHVKAEERRNATGHYHDGASVYEVNKFLDDSPANTGNGGNTESSASDDIDYKARYEELSSAYSNLEQQHVDLIDDHEEFRRDILGTDYNQSEDTDEPRFDVMDIEIQDPPVSEVDLSHLQGDSQSSAISISRLRTRVDAFLAASEGWNNISLMSTGDNHTEESQEL